MIHAPRDPSRHFVQSLERGLAVIRALSEPGPGLTLSDVARETGLARAVARRFLLTLQDLGYVRADDRRFSLTPRVLELGYSFLSSLTLPEIAQPHLRDLVGRVHESSSVSVLDGADVVYVAREPTRRIMTVHICGRHALPRLRHLDGPRPARRARGPRRWPTFSPPRRPARR